MCWLLKTLTVIFITVVLLLILAKLSLLYKKLLFLNQQLNLLLNKTTYDEKVVIEENGDTIIIGNKYIAREFVCGSGKLSTTKIINRRTDGSETVFAPGANSHEFTFKKFDKKENDDIILTPVDHKDWTVIVDSGSNAKNILDDDEMTYWYTDTGNYPHWFQIDAQKSVSFKCFSYWPRIGSDYGNMSQYELYAADKLEDLEKGAPIASGKLIYDRGQKPVYVNLDKECTARYFKFKGLSALNSLQFAGCAGFKLHTELAPHFTYETLTSNQLTLKSHTKVPLEGGQKLVFTFEPYKFQGIDWRFEVVYTMKDGDHFMRKHIEIQVPASQFADARIDYLDLESYVVSTQNATWTHPPCGSSDDMAAFFATCGQPFYVQGLFAGLEFPIGFNEIQSDGRAIIRQYSGKNYTELQKENRVTDNTFKTWPAVCGAARSTENEVITKDFLDYIATIQQKCNMRVQYNSWYDWMLDIDETNIITSFYEMERGLTQAGADTLEAYVVDDGWNEYSNKINKSGFWEWNSKFPNGLTQPKTLVQKLGSNFGLWLGPRGGYSAPAEFAKHIEVHKNGEFNPHSNDICTNHKTYLQKTLNFFTDCQEKYDIVYWKLDGFAYAPCPKVHEFHITGGFYGVHWMTEHWERWAGILIKMRQHATAKGIDDLWINLTTFAMPSPWFLQWGNSLWLQNSWDLGMAENLGLLRMVDQCLTYRDGRIYDFAKRWEHRIPFSCLYNHDPIYGKTGSGLQNTMNDDEFRTYIYCIMTRGAALVNLYFSYNMIDEGQKWLVTAECLNWRKQNYEILRNAVQFSEGDPADGFVYGYTAWRDTEGVVMIRNPLNRNQKHTIVLDRKFGVKEGTKNLWRSTVLAFRTAIKDDNTKQYNYAESITLDMEPGEVRIWKFSTTRDSEKATVEFIKTPGAATVHVLFTKHVYITSQTVVKVAGSICDCSLLADLRTVAITVPTMVKNAQYDLSIAKLMNHDDTELSASQKFIYFENHIIAAANSLKDIQNSSQFKEIIDPKYKVPAIVFEANQTATLTTKNSFSGMHDFNVSFVLQVGKPGQIFQQGDQILITVDNSNYLVFQVSKYSIKSSIPINNQKSCYISCCRERNGQLKIYINGKLDKAISSLKVTKDNLKAQQVQLGGKGFSGTIGAAVLSNQALNFKQNDAMANGDNAKLNQCQFTFDPDDNPVFV